MIRVSSHDGIRLAKFLTPVRNMNEENISQIRLERLFRDTMLKDGQARIHLSDPFIRKVRIDSMTSQERAFHRSRKSHTHDHVTVLPNRPVPQALFNPPAAILFIDAASSSIAVISCRRPLWRFCPHSRYLYQTCGLS